MYFNVTGVFVVAMWSLFYYINVGKHYEISSCIDVNIHISMSLNMTIAAA